MIFVTVGSSSHGFDRILEVVDELKLEKEINDKIIAQIGNSRYKPKKIEMAFKFKSWKEVNELYKKADMIISHAGAGTIITALKYNKPIICIPRLKEFGEHTDNHQLEIANALEKKKKILVARNKNELLNCIKKVKMGWKPKKELKSTKVAKEVLKFLSKVQ